MAKKNLARTAIEGGRAGRNKWERNYSHKEERSYVRSYTTELKKMVEVDDAKPIKKRKHVYKEFTDKLGPVYRWIEKQCGRKWDDVFSDIVKRYDTRNIAGRHIVYDHILREIAGTQIAAGVSGNWRYYKWHIDENGILQKRVPYNTTFVYRSYATKEQEEAFERERLHRIHRSHDAWLKDRKVIKHGHKNYWGMPNYAIRVITHPGGGTSEHKYVVDYSMGERLSVADLKMVKKFKAAMQPR